MVHRDREDEKNPKGSSIAAQGGIPLTPIFDHNFRKNFIKWMLHGASPDEAASARGPIANSEKKNFSLDFYRIKK